MNSVEAVSTARIVDDVLKWFGWLVVVFGVIAAVAAIFAGFDAVEPWLWGGVLVDEDWMSIGIGLLGAAYIALWTGVWWSLIQVVRLVAWYVTRKAAAA